MSKEWCWSQVFRVEVDKAWLVVPAQSSHLPRNLTHHVWHRAQRTCPPYPKENVVLAIIWHLLLEVPSATKSFQLRHISLPKHSHGYSHGCNAVSDVSCDGGHRESRSVKSMRNCFLEWCLCGPKLKQRFAWWCFGKHCGTVSCQVVRKCWCEWRLFSCLVMKCAVSVDASSATIWKFGSDRVVFDYIPFPIFCYN